MAQVSNSLFIFTIISAGFFAGQISQAVISRHIDETRYVALFIALRIAIPAAVLSAIWNLYIHDWSITLLPIIGAAIILSGFLIGLILCHFLQLNRAQTGVYAPAAGYTNIGAIGSFVVFMQLGEQGLALIPLFKLFEEIIYYALLFPYAARHSATTESDKKGIKCDPVIVITLSAAAVGFILNTLDIPRPQTITKAMDYLVPFGTFCLMYAVGLTFKTKSLQSNFKLAFLISFLKLTILPILAFAMVHALGLDSHSNGLLLKLCVLLSMMPMAFIVIVPAAIYKLDQELANTTWLTSTVLFLLALTIIPSIMNIL